MPSPTSLPSAAPILNTGMKIPLGTGIVDVMIDAKNYKKLINFDKNLNRICNYRVQ
jgi:hypothetical protein